MHQVLFRIPLPWLGSIPIYGFGTMLVVALFVGLWITTRRARHNDVNPDHVQDVAFWIIIAGIIGARLVFMVTEGNNVPGNWLWKFFAFWEGGLVFYGALLGGIVGYLLAWKFVLRKHKLSAWKLADIIIPAVALGLSFGRIGCLLNGCCYGAPVDPARAPAWLPALHFPANSYAGKEFLKGPQPTLAAGFRLDDHAPDRRTVAWVDPGTAAYTAGLRPGDVITHIDGLAIPEEGAAKALEAALTRTEITYTVRRNGQDVRLNPFQIETLELTQAPRKFSDVVGLTFQETEPEKFIVLRVEPQKPAAASGVQPRDVILRTEESTPPKQELTLRVERGGQSVELPQFTAQTVGLHPTQIYESISALLIFLLLTAYFPLRRRDGEVLVLFLVCYPIHRFLNEMLRIDTQPVFLGMTLSQNISLLLMLAAAVVAIVVLRRPVQYPASGSGTAAPA